VDFTFRGVDFRDGTGGGACFTSSASYIQGSNTHHNQRACIISTTIQPTAIEHNDSNFSTQALPTCPVGRPLSCRK